MQLHWTAIKLRGLGWTGLGRGVHLTALTLTIRTHLMRDRPKPEMAPYRPAADDVKQNDKKKPIQLKRNATEGRGKGFKLRQNYSLPPNPFKLKASRCKWTAIKWKKRVDFSDLLYRYGWVVTAPLQAAVEITDEILLKKVSMKMPSFPILSWSASSKSSLATKSSSCTSSNTITHTQHQSHFRFPP